MKRAWLAVLVAWLLSALALPGCSESEPPETEADASAWLAGVMSAHTRADTALAAGQSAVAIEILRGALEQPVAHEVAHEHARIVHQDLLFRLASAELASEPGRALLAAERGLALGRRNDLFTSNLLAVRGRALQSLGRDTEAVSSYREALAIDERLLDSVLRGGGAGGP